MDSETLLELENITKRYPGVVANQDVGLQLHAGEVKALLGENGAGKSTLIKGIMGIVQYDEGTIRLDGNIINFRNAHDAQKRGICAVFQELSQISSLTVAENIFINDEPRYMGMAVNRTAMILEAEAYLKKFRIDVDPREIVGNLTLAKRQLIEIVKATVRSPKVLILDEPTSALTASESEILYEIISNLKQQGTGIIYITHRLNEVALVADTVSILRDGRNVADFDAESLDMDKIVKHMVGRELDLYKSIKRNPINYKVDNPLLDVHNISVLHEDKGVSFKLYAGEILGVAGLVGSGRSELMQIIFGINKAGSGKILINGTETRIPDVQTAMKNGIAMIPENRHIEGLNLMHSISDNIVLPVLNDFTKIFTVIQSKISIWVDTWIDRLAIKTESRQKIVNQLSGGNQQKVVIAKWLGTHPKILIVDELTAGIDVGSKSEIHQKIRSLADEGMGIVLISSDMPELLVLSDRIVVMNNNNIIATLSGSATQEDIMSAIMKDNIIEKE